MLARSVAERGRKRGSFLSPQHIFRYQNMPPDTAVLAIEKAEEGARSTVPAVLEALMAFLNDRNGL